MSFTSKDPFKILKDEHKVMKKLFKQIEKLDDESDSGDACNRLFEELKQKLTKHMEKEEAIIYPSLKHMQKVEDMAFEAQEEHNVAKTLLRELDADGLDPRVWMAKLVVLRESIDHHVEEEEEELFPKATRVLSKEQRADMARSLVAAE